MKNLFKIHFTALLVGILLLASTSHACVIKAEKSCCKKEISSKSEKKECCSDTHSKNKGKHCDGKCGHSGCTTSVLNLNIISTNVFDIEFKNIDFYTKKDSFYHSKTFISSGFTSVWLPPKIK